MENLETLKEELERAKKTENKWTVRALLVAGVMFLFVTLKPSLPDFIVGGPIQGFLLTTMAVLAGLRVIPENFKWNKRVRTIQKQIEETEKQAKTAKVVEAAEEQRPKECRRVLAQYLLRLNKKDYDISRLEVLIDEGITPEDLEDDILAALDEKPRRDEEQELRAEWDLEGDLEAADIEGRITAVEKVVNRQKDQIVRVEDWRKEGRITDEEADRLIEKINSWAETTIQDIMGAQR